MKLYKSVNNTKQINEEIALLKTEHVKELRRIINKLKKLITGDDTKNMVEKRRTNNEWKKECVEVNELIKNLEGNKLRIKETIEEE